MDTNHKNHTRKIIGIDAGVKTGIFIFEDGKPKEGLLFESFWETIAFFEEHKDALFILEDPRKNKPVFGVDYVIAKMKKAGFSLKAIRENLNAFARKAQNVGNVKTRTEIIADFFEFSGFKYRLMKPIQGLKNEHTKKSFLAYTEGVDTLKNQHTQDAFWYAWYVNKSRNDNKLKI